MCTLHTRHACRRVTRVQLRPRDQTVYYTFFRYNIPFRRLGAAAVLDVGSLLKAHSAFSCPSTRQAAPESNLASGDASDGQRALAGGGESVLPHVPARCRGSVRSNRANARSLSAMRPGRAHDDRALRPTCKIPHTHALTVSCVIGSRVPQLNGRRAHRRLRAAGARPNTSTSTPRSSADDIRGPSERAQE